MGAQKFNIASGAYFKKVREALTEAGRYSPSYDITIKSYCDLLAQKDYFLRLVNALTLEAHNAILDKTLPEPKRDKYIKEKMLVIRLPQMEYVKLTKECLVISKSLGLTPEAAAGIGKKESTTIATPAEDTDFKTMPE